MANDGTAAIPVGPLKARLDASDDRLTSGQGVSASAAAPGSALARMVEAYATQRGIYNPSLQKFEALLAGVRKGKRRLKFAICDDSVGAGYGSDDTNAGVRATSYPSQLAAILAARGIAVNTASFWGSASRQNDAGYDPRLVRGNGWVIDPFSVRSLGGPVWYNNSTTNPLSFSPAGAFDSADVYAITNTSAQGQITIDVGGGTLATVNLLGPAALTKTTVTFPRTTNPTLNIRRVDASGSTRVSAAVLFDTTTPAVEIYNCGQSGATSVDAVSSQNPWEYRSALAVVAPDVTAIGFGRNDINPINNVSVAQYKNNIELIHQTAALSGDVIHMTHSPGKEAGLKPYGEQNLYAEARRELAVKYNTPLLDLYAMFGTYERGNSRGLYYDTLHPGLAGSNYIAAALDRLLSA